MGSGIYFPLSALLFSFLLVGLTFFKKHIKTVETKLYSLLVLSNSLGLFVELLCTYASYIYDKNVVLANFKIDQIFDFFKSIFLLSTDI